MTKKFRIAKSKNAKFLKAFSEFCLKNPDMRPMQALFYLLEQGNIYFGDGVLDHIENLRDTYNLSEKDLIKMIK